ncbi:DUF5675 family protein [Parvibaculum sp.]|jgi:hypothetical protein|uniref:DUF5675 family protein n=1 Tax=Parvibaculum sp. TaxID=2024848 RepID=UPI002733E031|nr:DUF5675 family protein [Parvibaculum sp.]MDP3327223.1 DUF5675 family protein [Parvibaculum sp.]
MREVTFTLNRLEHDGLATRGELLAGGTWLCYIAEDRYRQVKVPGSTRIPDGLYEIELKPVGTSRFDKVATEIMAAAGLAHHGMIRLIAVPNFSEVLYHWGNDQHDTEGCLLGGMTKMSSPKDGSLAVGMSRPAYQKTYPVLSAPLIRGDRAFIHIRNLDGTPSASDPVRAPVPLERPDRAKQGA